MLYARHMVLEAAREEYSDLTAWEFVFTHAIRALVRNICSFRSRPKFRIAHFEGHHSNANGGWSQPRCHGVRGDIPCSTHGEPKKPTIVERFEGTDVASTASGTTCQVANRSNDSLGSFLPNGEDCLERC